MYWRSAWVNKAYYNYIHTYETNNYELHVGYTVCIHSMAPMFGHVWFRKLQNRVDLIAYIRLN